MLRVKSLDPEAARFGQRLAAVTQAWTAIATPLGEAKAALETSDFYASLSQPFYPFGSAALHLSSMTLYAATPFTKRVAEGFEIDLSKSLSELIDLVHPEDQEVFAFFFETVSRPIQGYIDGCFRIFSNDESFVWLKVSAEDMALVLPEIVGHRLLFIQDVNTMMQASRASVVAWDERPGYNWQLLMPRQGGTSPLTPREMKVLALLVQGMGSKQIAQQLGISSHTVDTHRSNMLAKTGCSNTPSLVRYAIERNLV